MATQVNIPDPMEVAGFAAQWGFPAFMAILTVAIMLVILWFNRKDVKAMHNSHKDERKEAFQVIEKVANDFNDTAKDFNKTMIDMSSRS